MGRLYVNILSSLFALIIFSCTQDINEPASSDKGDISFSLEKNNKSAEAVILQIELTRNEFNKINQRIPLTNSASEEILIKDVPSGLWNLKVSTLDEFNQVLSSGKSFIEVTPLTVSKVNKLEWTMSIWQDYAVNPVFAVSQSPENPPFGVHSAKIIFENNKYKMWYTNTFFSAATTIGYAESEDGKVWVNAVSPVLSPGAVGQWDSRSVQIGAVVRVGCIYRMYYTGYTDHTLNWNIGIATSSDGHTWEKMPNPVLFGDSQEYQIHVDDVIKINNKYYMYYTIRNPFHNPFYSIGMAVSDDGISWTKHAGNPILLPTESWECGGVYFPSVIADSCKYRIVYMNANSFGFGFASSADGLTWQKEPGNPFFNKNELANNWASEIAYPYIRKFNGQYYLYYSGLVSGVYSIGLVTM